MGQKRAAIEEAVTELPSRDETAALAAVGGDSALARELIEALVRSLPEELAVLRRCIESRECRRWTITCKNWNEPPRPATRIK